MDSNYNDYNEIVDILKALSHPVRLCIVKGLLQQNGKCNVSHIKDCLSLPQSTVSQHLQKLKAAGIIKGERNGLEINYTVVNETAIKIINSIFF
ncbi:transcriptional repressor PagR [Clostridium tepidiprofundi DSM 19306]|uniref:Transcriptional repressor PagR n=1 Tax=Clostridium tepidiprofundi DSM 19306 TaxID=1121338 RepID=A0A151B5F9_9CLOT|nr:metalloregulator ArsR/SmtB family transcription factor [Clostridium tepidiprofundi]KYH35002.1 transcriptional repressor PagR [Clostridium tepidiprofundi DSM 19306]